MSSATVNFGLVGFGAWGKLHAQSISRTEGAKLGAIIALTKETRQEARKLYPDVVVLGDYRDIMEEPDLDIIDVVTPNHTHVEIATAAIAAGKHVLLEKPMALSLEDCRGMIAMAAVKKIMLAIGHELRLSSQWEEVKLRIEAGKIGVPQYVLVELSRRPYRPGADSWRYDRHRVGNWALEEPIHFFDLARWYLSGHGNPTTIYATANSIDSSRPDLNDNFSAIMRYDSGAYAVISQTLAAFEHHQTVKVSGTKGAITASWSGVSDRTLTPKFSVMSYDGESVKEVAIERPSGEVYELDQEIAMCVRCVQDGTAAIASGEDGLWSAGLCLAAEASIARGAVVSLAEFMAGK
ncbi:Gfo/Idh/MocA family oxidoreductase [soil metagenome]